MTMNALDMTRSSLKIKEGIILVMEINGIWLFYINRMIDHTKTIIMSPIFTWCCLSIMKIQIFKK